MGNGMGKNPQQARNTRPILYIDGECLLCSRLVRFVIDHESSDKILFSTLQSEDGINARKAAGIATDKLDTVVFFEVDKHYIKSEACLKVSQYLSFPYSFLGSVSRIIPLTVWNTLYNTVAKSRFKLSKSIRCPVFSESERKRFV